MNAVKKKISPLKAQKFNAKRCGCFAVNKVFFSPVFTANLTLFLDQTSTRDIEFSLPSVILSKITD